MSRELLSNNLQMVAQGHPYSDQFIMDDIYIYILDVIYKFKLYLLGNSTKLYWSIKKHISGKLMEGSKFSKFPSKLLNS